jgi:hypothetical protein
MATDPSPEVASAAAALSRITELADLLLTAGGELEVYSQHKELLQRWADAILPKAPPPGAAAAAADDDDDMFASGEGGVWKFEQTLWF